MQYVNSVRHPDKNLGNEEQATQKFRTLAAAYHHLSTSLQDGAAARSESEMCDLLSEEFLSAAFSADLTPMELVFLNSRSSKGTAARNTGLHWGDEQQLMDAIWLKVSKKVNKRKKGAAPPLKPWERNRATGGGTSLPVPPSSANAGPKPWELQPGTAVEQDTSLLLRTQPARPWERTAGAGALNSASPGASSGGSSFWSPGGSAAAMDTPGYPTNSSPYSTPYNQNSAMGGSGGMYGSNGNSYGTDGYGATGGGLGGYGAGGYGGSSSMYGAGNYGSSSYGSGGMYGTGGGMYGSGASNMYGGGSSMYGGGGGGMYGSSNRYGGGGSMYGGGSGMYGGGGAGGGMYGGGGGMLGGLGDPNNMYGAGAAPGMMGPNGMMQPGPNAGVPPPSNPWQMFMQAIHGTMHFCGRLSFLVDENTHALHFFISALLQLLDRAGSLYAELARFALRLLFRRYRQKKAAATPGVLQLPANGQPRQQQQQQGMLQSHAQTHSLPQAQITDVISPPDWSSLMAAPSSSARAVAAGPGLAAATGGAAPWENLWKAS
ncbi:MAG: hypothetical protein WDW36_007188 [Sanguina aurantia]